MAQRPLLSPLLVGRDHHLELADGLIREAGAGRGGMVLLEGEAGIGKSRLLGAIGRRARSAGMRVAQGGLAPADAEVPLASLLDLARTMRDGQEFGTLGETLLALRPGAGRHPLGVRRALVHDVADRLIGAIDRPTMLVFEDLQWADELSLEVIGVLARRAPGWPLALFAAWRDEALRTGSLHREWRSRLLAQRHARHAQLAPLTPEETALVTTLILSTGLPAGRDVVAAVHDRTDGIPLHIEELLAAVAPDDLAAGRKIRGAPVPATIGDAVVARLDRLSPDARSVALAASVVGRSFHPDVLAGIMDRPAGSLDEPLRELVDQALLVPRVGRDEIDFRHALVRDAIYGDVPRGELRRLHARAAEFGSLQEGTSEVHASIHYERAGLRAQAFRAALAGARAASAVSSRRDAYELYRRAMDNLPDGLSDKELGDLFQEWSEAALSIDDIAIGEAAAGAALRFYEAAGSAPDVAAVLVNSVVVGRRDVHAIDARLGVMDRLRTDIDALPPGRVAAWIDPWEVVTRAITLADAGLDAEAVVLADEGRRLVEATGIRDADMAEIVMDADILSLTLAAERDGAAGPRWRLLELARDTRDETAVLARLGAYRNAVLLAIRMLDHPMARESLREGAELADEIEQSYCRHLLAGAAATLAWGEGRWDDAAAEAGQELVEPGSRRGVLPARIVMGLVAMGRGDVATARGYLEPTLAEAIASGEPALIADASWALAETELIAGRPEAAVAHVVRVDSLARGSRGRPLLVPLLVTGVRAHLAMRRPDEAGRWLDACAARLAAFGPAGDTAVEHADGLVRLATNAPVVARARLGSAVRGWDVVGRWWEGTWARVDLAAALVRAGRHADATEPLQQALARAEAAGSEPLRARAADLLRTVRGRVVTDEPWRPLTVREFEVARLVAKGWTNHEIADELQLAPRTVNAHLEHILGKLGVGRRAEVAAWVSGIDAGAGAEAVAARR
jgi:DNA-binding CsgD family transcriptional regulator